MSEEAAATAVAEPSSAPTEAPSEAPAPSTEGEATPQPQEAPGGAEGEQQTSSEPAPQEKAGPMNKTEALAAMRKRFRQDRETQPEGSEESRPEGEKELPPRGEDGRFVKREETAGEDAATQAAETPGSEPTAADSPVAEGRVRIELDEGHPLRDQGKEYLDVPADLERDMRAAINQWTRRSEVEQAQSRIKTLESRLREAIIELEAAKDGGPQDLSQDPEWQKLVEDVRKTYSPDKAEELIEALRAKKELEAMNRRGDAARRFEMQQHVDQFQSEVVEQFPKRYPVWKAAGEADTRMAQAVDQYATYIDSRNDALRKAGRPEQPPSAQEFISWVDRAYLNDQRVQEQLNRYRADQETKKAEQIRREEQEKLAAAERERIEEQKSRHRRPPPLGGAHRDVQSMTGEAPAKDLSAMTPSERRRAVAEDVRRRYGHGS